MRDVGCTSSTMYFALLLLSVVLGSSELSGVSFSVLNGMVMVAHWAKRFSERAVAVSTFN